MTEPRQAAWAASEEEWARRTAGGRAGTDQRKQMSDMRRRTDGGSVPKFVDLGGKQHPNIIHFLLSPQIFTSNFPLPTKKS